MGYFDFVCHSPVKYQEYNLQCDCMRTLLLVSLIVNTFCLVRNIINCKGLWQMFCGKEANLGKKTLGIMQSLRKVV